MVCGGEESEGGFGFSWFAAGYHPSRTNHGEGSLEKVLSIQQYLLTALLFRHYCLIESTD
jgi:hypothetical protein